MLTTTNVFHCVILFPIIVLCFQKIMSFIASPVVVSTIPQKSSFFCQKKTDRFPIVVVALSDRDVVIISAEFSRAILLEGHKKDP